MQPRKPGTVPLARALSKLGIASRSQAIQYIQAGRISVNNAVCTDPSFAVVPERVRLKLDGKDFSAPQKITYLLYKPSGVITTRSDEKGRPTVFSLLKNSDMYLHAVGRLDMATTGLLLLTNDTRLSSYLTDPVNEIVRTYVVTVRGLVTEEELVEIKDHAKSILLRKTSKKESHLVVTLTEGKNREIRKLFQSIDHEVTRLKRIGFGELTLGSLQPSEYRELTTEEIRAAFPNCVL